MADGQLHFQTGAFFHPESRSRDSSIHDGGRLHRHALDRVYLTAYLSIKNGFRSFNIPVYHAALGHQHLTVSAHVPDDVAPNLDHASGVDITDNPCPGRDDRYVLVCARLILVLHLAHTPGFFLLWNGLNLAIAVPSR